SADFWITGLSFPIGFYKTLKQISFIKIFPSSLPYWINTIKILFGNKELSAYSYRNLIGQLFIWPFAKSEILNFNADAFFLKRKNKYTVLFYFENQKSFVVKANIDKNNRNTFQRQIKREVFSQSKALEIKHHI